MLQLVGQLVIDFLFYLLILLPGCPIPEAMEVELFAEGRSQADVSIKKITNYFAWTIIEASAAGCELPFKGFDQMAFQTSRPLRLPNHNHQ